MNKKELMDLIHEELDDKVTEVARDLAKKQNEEARKNVKRLPLGGEYVEFAGVGPAVNKTFKGMFGDRGIADGGFENFGDFLKTINSGRADDRLITKAPSGSSEGIPSDGGFLVPTEYSAQLLDTALESEIVRPRAMSGL